MPPTIVRFYGTGRSVEPRDEEFESFLPMFPDMPTVRNFIVIDVDTIAARKS